MNNDICLHRAKNTCCPEPSCDYVEHNLLIKKELDKSKIRCANCGKKCIDCDKIIENFINTTDTQLKLIR